MLDFHPGRHDALLVIDVQRDFCAGGRLEVPGGDEVVAPINRLAEQFKTVAITQDWHPAGHSSFASSHAGAEPFSEIMMPYGPQVLWPDHCIQNSKGAKFHKQLDTSNAAVVIRKGFRPDIDSYSAFFENDHRTPTGLANYLRECGIQRVYCVGLALDFCVRFSAEDARAQGFETSVILNACRAIDQDGSLSGALNAMRNAGVQLLA
ncbi:MAG: bifunctional nicotinamidase/pyrazinamidase [Pseudomonadota bacterium]